MKVIGIGTPCVDYVIEVPHETLAKLPGTKGGMIAVDFETLTKIIKDLEKAPRIIFGGSAANTIKGLAQLGHQCWLVGRIGGDTLGQQFQQHLTKLSVKSFLIKSTLPTAQVLCLITPDRERTMRTFLGASQEMTGDDLHASMFSGANLVHVEGYSLLRQSLPDRAMELGKQAGALISFDLGSFEIAHLFKNKIIHLLAHYVDIVFANEEEVKGLTQLSPQKGCEFLRDLCKVAVVLIGKEGAFVGNEKTVVFQPAYQVNTIDTTGAGDLFASGFLHGYLQGKSIEECAKLGALIGSEVVQILGVEIPEDRWDSIKNRFD